MRTIHKYRFDVLDVVQIVMPYDSRILPAVQVLAYDELAIWAEVSTDQPMVTRTLQIVGTGNPISDVLGRYVATADTGSLVWHIYEAPDPDGSAA